MSLDEKFSCESDVYNIHLEVNHTPLLPENAGRNFGKYNPKFRDEH